MLSWIRTCRVLSRITMSHAISQVITFHIGFSKVSLCPFHVLPGAWGLLLLPPLPRRPGDPMTRLMTLSGCSLSSIYSTSRQHQCSCPRTIFAAGILHDLVAREMGEEQTQLSRTFSEAFPSAEPKRLLKTRCGEPLAQNENPIEEEGRQEWARLQQEAPAG
ncbi:hypothetical protein CapIbe_014415 [Capra ibex]